MDQTDGTLAFASDDQWIGRIFLRAPADSTLDVVLIALSSKILDTFDLLSLFELLFVKLSFAHGDLIALEIFDSEPDSTKFDSVKFLNLVIVFSSFIFE